jgi:hypothetical protein
MLQEATHPGALQRHTGTPTDLRVGTAVALSSVAKYWVLTNLFPGPIPQVSVYGLHPPRVGILEICYICSRTVLPHRWSVRQMSYSFFLSIVSSNDHDYTKVSVDSDIFHNLVRNLTDHYIYL